MVGDIFCVKCDRLGFAGSKLFGLGVREAIAFGAMVALSSTAVVLRILMERSEIERRDQMRRRRQLQILLGVAAAIIRDIVKQMNEDIPIWEHKIYRPAPTLCDGDGPIPEFRRWCRQFYPEAGA